MDDARVWNFEESLWKASPNEYRADISSHGLLVVPEDPFVMTGKQAADAMADTPRWDEVAFSKKQVSRPDGDEGGLIVIAYRADAKRGDEDYSAWCSSTYLRRGHEDWVVVQHQQTPELIKS